MMPCALFFVIARPGDESDVKRKTVTTNVFYLSANVFRPKVQIEDTIFTSSTGDRTTL